MVTNSSLESHTPNNFTSTILNVRFYAEMLPVLLLDELSSKK